MANKSGNAYGLTTFCPIKIETINNQSAASVVRAYLQDLGVNERSPMAKVPNTYFSRFYVLTELLYQGRPAKEDQLKSPYLIFTSNFHGDLEPYLWDMWKYAEPDVRATWKHCVAFDKVTDAESFIEYIKKCQVTTTLFFNGSTDDSLEEQLKSLYLKQEFAKFVQAQQGASPADLQAAFKTFTLRTRPDSNDQPTWRPGMADFSVPVEEIGS